ncbi:MAG: hypothetical protein K2X35_09355 [Bryobacteraceae bacterium]|nr:hypothetical protein [Bryobacteraceae bacterium]
MRNWILALLALGTAQAQLRPVNPAGEPPAALADRQGSSAPSRKARLLSLRQTPDARVHFYPDGSPRSAYGIRSEPYEGSPQSAAIRFANENLLTTATALRVVSFREDAGVTTVRVEQIVDNIPVRGGEAVLVADAEGRITEFSSAFKNFSRRSSEWALDESAALAKARQARQVRKHAKFKATRFYQVIGGEAVPVWVVEILSEQPRADWQFVVHAGTGAILEVRDLRQGQRGNVFRGNPVTSRLEEVTLPGLGSSAVLTGPNARIFSLAAQVLGLLDLSDPIPQTAQRTNGNFLFDISDPRFSEVQMYFSIHTVAERFRAIGFRGLGRPLDAVVWFHDFSPETGFTGEDNAFFSPLAFDGDGGLFFYLTATGGDTAWDTDVAFHEYGHAVVNAFVPGQRQGPTFRAMNEGMADYFSASFLRDPNIGEWFVAISQSESRLPFLRTTENPNVFPRNITGLIHSDGNMLSGALWEVRTALGAENGDRVALGMLARLTGEAEFFDAAVAAEAAAGSLFGATAAATVREIMTRRGLRGAAAEIAGEAQTLPSGVIGSGAITAAAAGSTLIAFEQFRIDVPNGADALRLEVAATGNVRAFLRFRSPVLVENGQVNAEQTTNPGTELTGLISLDSTPELQAGVYYLAIGNTTTAQVRYQVRLTTVGGSPDGLPRLTRVLNNTTAPGSLPTGPFLGSRQFLVDVPAGAQSLTVNLDGTTDVDLYVNHNRPVIINSQGFPEADALSDSALSRESITLNSRSIPPLRAGVYAIGVLNFDDRGIARFNVSASIGNTPLPPAQISALAAGTSANVALERAAGTPVLAQRQVTLTIPANAQSLRVQVDSAQRIAVLLRWGSAVETRNGQLLYDQAFLPAPGAGNAITLVRPDLRSGTYFCAFANLSSTAGSATVRYSITASSSAPPAVSAGGVADGFTFQAGVTPGAWIGIFGANLATSTRTWDGAIQGNRLPTSLDGVSVRINGRPAVVYSVSPVQVNVLAPLDDSPEGEVDVVLSNANGASPPVRVRKQNFLPAFYAPFGQGQDLFVTAVALDGTIVGRPGTDPRVRRAARPGEIIQVYGTGFGRTNPQVPADTVFSGAPTVVNRPVIRIGNTVATFAGNGNLVAPGLYQFNITVPNLPDGDYAIVAEVGGIRSGTRIPVLLSIRR